MALRIKEIRDKKNLTQDEIVKKTGLKKRSYVDYENGKSDIPFSKLQKIAKSLDVTISEICGEKELKDPIHPFLLRTDSQLNNQSIPLFNIEATAGLVELFQNTSKSIPIDTLSIPNLPKCDGAVFVTGDSMYPLLKSGDIVAYKQINDIQNEIFWGEMYLISIEVSGEEFISVKYIQKSEKGDQYIKLVSQNIHHQPKDVLIRKVRAMAIVKASVRINSMR